MSALWLAFRHLLRLCGSQRKLWLPFLVVALAESILLLGLWLAPHPPFSFLLAPPVQYFFGERVLHYPWHLWFLYRAMKHAHVAASTLVGAFMSGIACVMVGQVHIGSPLSVRAALVGRQARYGTLLLVWFFAWMVARGTMDVVLHAVPKGVWVPFAAVAASVILQALFVYAIPAAVFEQAGWFKATARGVREALHYPLSTLAILAIPSTAVIGLALLASDARVLQWMVRTSPEVAVICVMGRLLVWTIADALLTVGVAHLWWVHHEPVRVGVSATISKSALPGSQRVLHRDALVFSGVCVAVLAIFTTGCSASYQGERLFWKARQVSGPLEKDPAGATSEHAAKAIAAYERVIRYTPGTIWAARAQFAIGWLHASRKEYDRARDAYALVVRNYGQYGPLCLGARLALARLDELEQRWPDAVRVYQDIAMFHPWSAPGLAAPLHIADGFEQRHDANAASTAYRSAIETYTKLLLHAPTPALSNHLKGLLAVAHQRVGNWDRAVTLLEEIADATDGVNRPYVLLTLGTIYQARLGDAVKAQQWYARLLKEFPESSYARIAEVHVNEPQETTGKLATTPALSTMPTPTAVAVPR